MRQLRTVSYKRKQMLELCACASSGQFPIKENRYWSCAHAPAQDSFLEEKQMLELTACMRQLRTVFCKKHKCWSCAHAPAQDSFL
jgi:hypothetical protein